MTTPANKRVEDAVLIAAWYGNETHTEVGHRLGISESSVRSRYKRLAAQGKLPICKREYKYAAGDKSHDAELIKAWHGKEKISDIGKRLGLSTGRIKNIFKRLAERGLISSRVRWHVPASVRASRSRTISVGSDKLLVQLVRIHGSAK